MATDGIENIFELLARIIKAPVYPDDVIALVARWPEPPSSFVGQFLKQHAETFIATVGEADLIDGLLICLHNGWVSEAGPRMKHGIWDHFKGGIYLSEDLGKNADTGELEVRYISLLHGTKHQRRCSQWNEVVMWPDGKYRSRFIYRGANLEVPDPPPFKVVTSAIREHVERVFLAPGVPARKAEE